MVAFLDGPLQRSIAQHGSGLVLSLLESLNKAHAVHMEHTKHGMFIKIHYACKGAGMTLPASPSTEPELESSDAKAEESVRTISRETLLSIKETLASTSHAASNRTQNSAIPPDSAHQPETGVAPLKGKDEDVETTGSTATMRVDKTTLTMRAMKTASKAMKALKITKAKKQEMSNAEAMKAEATKPPEEEMSWDNQLLLRAFKDLG